MRIDALPPNVNDLLGAPPYRLGGHTYQQIIRAWLTAGITVAIYGIALFGLAAAIVIGAGVASAVVTDAIIAFLVRDQIRKRWQRAALTGLLLALTLPATTPWAVA